MRPSIAFLPAFAALALLGACDKQKPLQPQADATPAAEPLVAAGKVDTSHRGEAMPTASFLGPDGGPAALTAFRGRPTLVNLWATWCAPCVREMPALDALAGSEAKRLAVVAVSQDMAGKRDVEPFFAKAGLTHLQPYLDKQNVLMEALKLDTLPVTILYDAAGRERWRVVGTMDWSGAPAKKLIDDAMAVAG